MRKVSRLINKKYWKHSNKVTTVIKKWAASPSHGIW